MAVSLEPINIKKLKMYQALAMDTPVRYGLGSKVRLDTPVEKIRIIDCSGWVRWLVFNTTKDHLTLPDGSWIQRAFLQGCDKDSEVIERVDYREAVLKNPNALYLSFCDPKPGISGHVWFVFGGLSYESHGGRGVSRRPWNYSYFMREVDYCFRWEHAWE